ncbi:hypothetical protein FRAHR75_270062 [Frankia sp. Hr75.2]|nr:hypothetical protein FRAHR75_270062 [Frankia sp. Hr75.2]
MAGSCAGTSCSVIRQTPRVVGRPGWAGSDLSIHYLRQALSGLLWIAHQPPGKNPAGAPFPGGWLLTPTHPPCRRPDPVAGAPRLFVMDRDRALAGSYSDHDRRRGITVRDSTGSYIRTSISNQELWREISRATTGGQ